MKFVFVANYLAKNLIDQMEEVCVLTTLDAIVSCGSDTFVSDFSSFILPSPPIKTSASLFTATNFDMYLL
jgi:hypothetical protein